MKEPQGKTGALGLGLPESIIMCLTVNKAALATYTMPSSTFTPQIIINTKNVGEVSDLDMIISH